MAQFENAEGDHEQRLENLMKKFNLQDDVDVKAFLYEFEDLISDSQDSEDTLIRKLCLLNNYLWGERKEYGDYTHLQAACKHGFNDVVEKMLRYREDPNSRVRHTGDSPLILALKNDQVAVVEVLLNHRADPNLANNDGMTPLHIMCQKEEFNEDLARVFFKGIDDKRQEVKVDAKDNLAHTPLHLAVARGHRKAVALLLKRGANPNLADAEGSTPMHLICQGHGDLEMMYTFFKVTDYMCSLGRIDTSRDKRHNTPLHLAVRLAHSKNNRMMVRELLSRDADPNMTDAKGETALHIVCKRPDDETELLETLFRVAYMRRQPLLVDALDGKDRTPLEVAAAALFPNKVRVLLDNGADASSFIFRYQDFVKEEDVDFDLETMSRILSVFEHLESKGFMMGPTEMKPLVVEIAKRIQICQGVSLYDAASDNEAARELRYEVFCEFVSSDDLWQLPQRHVESCRRRLCNVLKRELRKLAFKVVRNMTKKINRLIEADMG